MVFSEFVHKVCMLLRDKHGQENVGVLDLCKQNEADILNVFIEWYNNGKTPEQTADIMNSVIQTMSQYLGNKKPLPDLTQKFEVAVRSSLGKRNVESFSDDLHASMATVRFSFDQGKMIAIIWISDSENRTLVVTMKEEAILRLHGHLSQQVEAKRRLDNGEYPNPLTDSRKG